MPVATKGSRTVFPSGASTRTAQSPRGEGARTIPGQGVRTGRRDPVGRPALFVQAACRGMGPDFFYPSSSVGVARATRVCAGCPDAEECLEKALDDPSLHGIWGGTSAREREYMRNEEGLGWG